MVARAAAPWCSIPAPSASPDVNAAIISVIFGAVPHVPWCQDRNCGQYVSARQMERYLWWHTHLGFSHVYIISFYNQTIAPPGIDQIYPFNSSCVASFQRHGWLTWLPTPYPARAKAEWNALELAPEDFDRNYKSVAISDVYQRHQHRHDWIGVTDTDELVYPANFSAAMASSTLAAGQSLLSAALTYDHGSERTRISRALHDAPALLVPVHVFMATKLEDGVLPTSRCRAYGAELLHGNLLCREEKEFDSQVETWKTVHRTGFYNLSGQNSMQLPPAIPDKWRRYAMHERHGLRIAHIRQVHEPAVSRQHGAVRDPLLRRLASPWRRSAAS